MFYGYPIAATADNWLHDCLREIVASIHASLDQGKRPPGWPKIIPDARRDALSDRPGLKACVAAYRRAAAALTAPQRQQVLTCLGEQNAIAELVNGAANCQSVSDLPATIRGPIVDLFTFAFKLLTPLGIRDPHYRAIYDAIPDHVCPFCGMEFFDPPGAHREDLDHYLARTIYPFAAANLRNLSPMGGKCNGYKLQQDMLWTEQRVRRNCFNPYAERTIKVSLTESVPFGAADGVLPQWQIDFQPDSLECATWDAVLRVRERLQRDVLDRYFNRWLGSFAEWFVRRKGLADTSNARIVESVKEYVEDLEMQHLQAREAFRVHVFEMVLKYCEAGNERLLAFIRDLFANAPHPVAGAAP
jgi:hypothetical protein